MELELKKMLTTPDSKTFHFDINEGGSGVKRRAEADGESPDLWVELKYDTPRQYRELLGSAVERKAKTAKGAKALSVSEMKARRLICQTYVLKWHMTTRAAAALGLGVDLSKCKPEDTIPFNGGNLEVMVERSEFSGLVDLAMSSNDWWFGRPAEEEGDDAPEDKTEDSRGNSGSGQSGSSERQPAATASPGTSTPGH